MSESSILQKITLTCFPNIGAELLTPWLTLTKSGVAYVPAMRYYSHAGSMTYLKAST